MNVLIPVLHRPSKPTGVCRHAANLAKCLADIDRVSHITLVVGEWQLEYFEQSFNLDSPKIQLVSIDIKNSSLSRNQWFIFGLPKLAHQLRSDIIHLSFPLPLVRQWFKAPVVSTIHDLYPYECPENFGYPQVWFNQTFLRQCVYNSDGLICVSKCTLESLEKYFPQVKKIKQTAVIYNVVDFAGIEPKVPRQLGTDSSNPFLLTVAQHRKNKNLDLLIQAYSTLLHDGRLQPTTRLLLVGSPGPETDHITHLVQTLKLDSQVLFLSGLEDGELRWLYEHASLFVIPSSAEGFCLPLAEALTLSCSAVCSDIPIFREVGSLRCRYFQLEQKVPRHLTDAIATELLHPPAPRPSTDLRFSKETVAQQLFNFYRLFLSHEPVDNGNFPI